MLIPEGAEILDVSGPLSAFSAANRIVQAQLGHSQKPYILETLGRAAGPVAMADGVQMVANKPWGRVRNDIDTLFVPGAADVAPMLDARTLAWLERMSDRVRRLVSVCTGALVLAEAGLLDGRKATTHWESTHKLEARGDIDVHPDEIYIRDGHIWSSAGISAGIDLTLALIEEDFSRAIAQATARELVVFLRRPGGQAQFSAHLIAQDEEGDELDDLLDWALINLDADLSVTALADRAAISERHLRRLFKERRGMSPSEFVEMARVDAARRLLEEPGASLKEVAHQTGFHTVERLRRACSRQIGVLPSEYKRRNAGESPHSIN